MMKQFYLQKAASFKRMLSFGRRGSDVDALDCSSLDCSAPVRQRKRPAWRCFSYDELDDATSGFRRENLVGRGGHAEVYRGTLEDGRAVAVKRLSSAADEKREKEFLTELGTVSHVDHPNVSPLVGFCVDGGLYLVFEYSSRGSVSSNLHDSSLPGMAWSVRHGIAVGAARGLQYLHNGSQRRIIHRDIKASNILLNANFEPQISDFGLARWLPSQWTHHAIAPIEGTFGCLAPEYFTNGIVDEKTDVFAFGVFILELVSGRKPVDGSHKNLLAWARPYLGDGGDVAGLADERLGGDYDAGQLRRLALVASLCVRASATWRPSMAEVLELLEVDSESSTLLERLKMPEDEMEDDDLWYFEDLDEDDDDEDLDSQSLFSSTCST